MKIIEVSASSKYDVIIDAKLLDKCGEYCRPFCPNKRAAIITDTNVAPLYLEKVTNSLKENGITAIHYIIPAGEESKCGNTYLSILNYLAENRLTRTDTLIALGGGVVGDLVGFVAATYLRGISFIQIPTTLLAMVDSSVGGKTAINLPAGKNLAGAFYQPKLVLCDYSALDTLPDPIFEDGCAEIIKYAVLKSPSLFEHLTQCGKAFDREKVITECVTIKRDIVNADEFESGPRKFLNLGHTVGHAIEQCSHFKLSHGKSVAAGLAIIAECAAKTQICDRGVTESICALNTKFNLPNATPYPLRDLLDVLLSDKKRSGNRITFILPKKIGDCFLHTVDVSLVEAFLSPAFDRKESL